MARPVRPVRKAPTDAKRAQTLRGGAFALTRDLRLAPIHAADGAVAADLAGAAGAWVFEPILEGHRVFAARAGDSVRIVSADFREWTQSLPQIRRALLGSGDDPFVVDGTLIALDDKGAPSFDRLRALLATGADAGVLLVASDLVRDPSGDLQALPYAARRERLAERWAAHRPPLVLSQTLGGSLDDALKAVRTVGLSGVVARSAGAGYGSVDPPSFAISATTEAPQAKRHLCAAPHVTNATKVLYPRDGITKTDIFGYYREIAPVLLSYMKDRPIVGQRFPDGIDDFTWYQHRVPPRAPDYLRAVMVEDVRRILVDNEDALLWLVNQAALTFHGFASRTSSLPHPDWLMIDLDPGEDTPWKVTVEVALAVRRLLELLEVESVVKTSGQKGIHILVPLAPKQDGPVVQRAALTMAQMICRLMPDAATIETERAKRKGRLLVDTTQGFVGKILVLPYSMRAVDGATISAPLAWSEVGASLDPRSFDLRSIFRRLERSGDLARPLLTGQADASKLLARLSRS